MAIRQSWRFEKDAFGKKHRKYFLQNIFGSDVADMQTFRALKAKISKDYLVFFNGIDKRYERGEHKQMAKKSVNIALATISLLSDMIKNGIVDAESIDVIVDNVGNLNASRDFFVQQSEGVKALKERLNQVESETGVGPEALNISKKIITAGAKKERKSLKEGVLPFLGRTAPRTAELGKELLGGVGTALLGPFAPIAGMGLGLAKDVFGVGRGLLQKRSERKQQHLGTTLRARAFDSAGTGGSLQFNSILSTQRKKVGAESLYDFYNKGALKAKWTKSLLIQMKKIAGFGGGVGDGAGGALGGLFAGGAIAGVFGRGGGLALVGVKLAALAGVSVFAANRIKTLVDVLDEHNTVQDKVNVEIKKQLQLQKMFNAMRRNVLNKSLGEQLQVAIKSGDEPARKWAMGMIKIQEEKRVMEDNPTSRLTSAILGFWNMFKRKSKANIFKPGEPVLDKMNQNFRESSLTTLSTSGGSAELHNHIDGLIVSLDELSAKMKVAGENRTQALSPQIYEPGVGNIYDPSDPILNDYTGGKIELRQE